MTDKIPLFKEEIDHIPVPVDKLDAIIAKTVQEGMPKKKNSLRKKLLLSVSAATVALGLLVGSASVSPVMANIVSHIPLLNSIFSESGDLGLKQVSELGLTQVVGESKTVKGNTLTIDEVFYDGTRISVGYSLVSEQPLEKSYIDHATDFKINGKRFSLGGSSGETEITSTYRTGIFHIEPSDVDVPKTFKLGLAFEGKGGEKWKFSIPVHTQTGELIPIHETQQVDDIVLNISNLELSPVGLRLAYQTVTNGEQGAYMKFRAVDAMGKELEISSEGGGYGEAIDGYMKTKGNSLFAPVDKHIKEITITPYLDIPASESGVEITSGNKEKSINIIPRNGDLEFESFTVKLP